MIAHVCVCERVSDVSNCAYSSCSAHRYQYAAILPAVLVARRCVSLELLKLLLCQQQPRTGSLGTTSLLDPEEYRVNRENATAQA